MESEKRYKASTRGYIVDRTNADVMDTHEAADRLNALEAELDRYKSALERIELMDPDWTLGVDENMSRLQSIAGRALKGGA